jgi:adenylate cyclase
VIRFRSFRTRLLVLILGLAGVSQLVALLIIDRGSERIARTEIQRQFERETANFERSVRDRNAALIQGAEAVSFDEGLRSALGRAEVADTLPSALNSLRGRLKADLGALLDLDGKLKAETRTGPPADEIYHPLFVKADAAEGEIRASGYGVIGGELHSLVVVPLRAPDVIAWIVLGFRLDRTFLDQLQETTDVKLALRLGSLEANLPPVPSGLVAKELPLATVGATPAAIRLTISLDDKLEPARKLEALLLYVGLGTLAAAGLVSLLIARGVSEPVRRLAAHTEVIARGDYAARLRLDQADELGQLAESFNAMSAGLAERDRVRDLLDKNVSPEVAAQLMRDGAALGGEEREVTILFADLRGFTTFSETQAPRAVVTQLNRYLDRMSAEIERHGGVIDKFIGDEIMALFGAPVAQPNAADRALSAALGMLTALDALNREFSAEGHPPLGVGIGINTARVVAGNIGSHRRLNYSVIGDGVNVAARLQGLTRRSEYAAEVILSHASRAATRIPFSFRHLGSAEVKGRSEPVVIYALERVAGKTVG